MLFLLHRACPASEQQEAAKVLNPRKNRPGEERQVQRVFLPNPTITESSGRVCVQATCRRIIRIVVIALASPPLSP